MSAHTSASEFQPVASRYNAERVGQPGSMILNTWRAERERAKRVQAADATGLTLDQLADLYGYSAGSYAGPAITQRSALAVSAVYACVALIGGAIGSLPLPIYQRTDTGRERAKHAYWWLLNERPRADVSAAVFWEYLTMALLLHGDAFAEIERPSPFTNQVTGLRALHPDRVEAFRANGALRYRVTDDSGGQRVITAEDMVHVPGLGFDGLRGLSVIRFAARQAIGTSLAAEEYSGRFFSNNARPDVVLTAPGDVSKEQADLLRATWMKRHSGAANAHIPAVLAGGLDVKQISLKPEDTQLIQVRGWQVEDVCRFFGVPPHMVGHTDKNTSWGAGVENMGRGFVKFTLSRLLVKFEQEINFKFWPNRERYFVEFLTAGLERGDFKSRNEGYRIAMGRAGERAWMDVDEVRALENLPPASEALKAQNEKASAAKAPPDTGSGGAPPAGA